jgi:hypothetical protein
MAYSIQVECVTETDRQRPHERIESIGGRNLNGSRWQLSVEEAIAAIKGGRWSFHTSVDGRTVRLVVATSEGREYLKTEADGVEPNNLLTLPDCPR